MARGPNWRRLVFSPEEIRQERTYYVRGMTADNDRVRPMTPTPVRLPKPKRTDDLPVFSDWMD